MRNNEEVRGDIISILDCLLKNKQRQCDTCRNCEDVDVCCFLTDAVVVCKNTKKTKND